MIKSQYVEVVCSSPSYGAYSGFYVNGNIVSCREYYDGYVLGPINTVGGIFFGIGVTLILLCIGLYWTGRVQPVLPSYMEQRFYSNPSNTVYPTSVVVGQKGPNVTEIVTVNLSIYQIRHSKQF